MCTQSKFILFGSTSFEENIRQSKRNQVPKIVLNLQCETAFDVHVIGSSALLLVAIDPWCQGDWLIYQRKAKVEMEIYRCPKENGYLIDKAVGYISAIWRNIMFMPLGTSLLCLFT